MPAGLGQPGQRRARIAAQVELPERLLAALDGMHEHRVDEVAPGREMPVERDPPDAGRLRDLARTRGRIAAQALRRRGHDRGDVPLRIRPLTRGLRHPHSSCRTPLYELLYSN